MNLILSIESRYWVDICNVFRISNRLNISINFHIHFHSLLSDDEMIDLRNGVPSDNFGASFIFERALKRMDVQTQQRRLQQEKYESQLNNVENDNKILELKLTNKDKDLQKLSDKLKNSQVFISFVK